MPESAAEHQREAVRAGGDSGEDVEEGGEVTSPRKRLRGKSSIEHDDGIKGHFRVEKSPKKTSLLSRK